MTIEDAAFPDALLTPDEVAMRLRVKRSKVLRMLRAEKLTGHKVGREWRVLSSELEKFIQGK